jgi:outer membrane protein assembly factor BamE
MSKFLIPSIMATSLALTACTAIVESIPGVYTIDVQQGNIINQEIVDQLRPNMNKRQVLYIMRTPMLRDVFHKKRWEYIFSEQPGGEERLQKRVSLYFKGDALIGVQGDFRPSNVT